MKRYTDIETIIADGLVKRSELVPPCCVTSMQQEFVEYVVGKSITYAYPVLENYANPRNAMQGGFIAAAFDNSFGALSFLVTGKMEIASIELSVSYHKPIYVNDLLTTTVYIKSSGKTILYLYGEAFDNQKNLIASSTTNVIILNRK